MEGHARPGDLHRVRAVPVAVPGLGDRQAPVAQAAHPRPQGPRVRQGTVPPGRRGRARRAERRGPRRGRAAAGRRPGRQRRHQPGRDLGVHQLLAQQNIETLNEAGVGADSGKKVIASCAHCFNTIGREYPQLGGNYEVVHHTELLAKLVEDGKLTPVNEADQKVTYHDPCFLGRHNKVFAPPRELIGALPGTQAEEMTRSGHRGRRHRHRLPLLQRHARRRRQRQGIRRPGQGQRRSHRRRPAPSPHHQTPRRRRSRGDSSRS
jgi:Cysteine-rich domain